MPMKRMIAVAVAAALSACGPSGENSPYGKEPTIAPHATPASPCGADTFTDWVGKTEKDLDLTRLPRAHRWVCKDCAITQDNVPARINFDLDEGGKITRVWCG
jgi:hypothetical protein